MDAETKQYNFTEKRAAQLEKARLKRWELHNKEKAEPQEEEKPPEPEVEKPVVVTPPPEPPKKEEPPEPKPEVKRPPSPKPERPPSPPPPVVEKSSFQFTRNGTLLFYDE